MKAEMDYLSIMCIFIESEQGKMTGIHDKILLITYADSMGKNIKELHHLLNQHFQGAIGGIHLLPFFPSSGDRGFAPITYRQVDDAFGSWEDIEALAKDYALMADFMVNHISAQSEYYQDFLVRKEDSPYRDLFIRYLTFWKNGYPSEEEVDKIYKRKPKAPCTTAMFADGSEEKVWCTFGEEQIDLNCDSDVTRQYIQDTLAFLAKRGISVIRLDAFAYAIKRAGSSCFFIEPDIWKLLDFCVKTLEPYGVQILPEIHEHYEIQMKIADKGYYVYDFALPMLLIHALYYGETKYLKHWLTICPRTQYTTLDTHDGIGVVDVRDLLPEDEIDRAKEDIFKRGANVKKVYNTVAYNNFDIYQINCTYYSALGNDDNAYLLARAVQFFAPGIPQVYYVGLLAGKNDLELLEKTKEGRNINRHYYSESEVQTELERPVVKTLLDLMRFRNSHPAFEGDLTIEEDGSGRLILTRESNEAVAKLHADFAAHRFTITGKQCNEEETVLFDVR
jgi:sucrose phosphorylase